MFNGKTGIILKFIVTLTRTEDKVIYIYLQKVSQDNFINVQKYKNRK